MTSSVGSTGTSNSTPATAAGSSTGTTDLASNFETFLTLLTTQLKNQDPLSPMDTEKFTSQLVQFASVEQQLKTNTNLGNLVSLVKTSAVGTALGFLGSDVTVDGSRVSFDSSGGTTHYKLARDAAKATASVYDASGKKLYSADVPVGAGAQQWGWNGKLVDGTSLPAGVYRVEIEAVDEHGQAVAVDMNRTGKVTSVDTTGTAPQLIVGGVAVPLEAVTDVRRPAA